MSIFSNHRIEGNLISHEIHSLVFNPQEGRVYLVPVWAMEEGGTVTVYDLDGKPTAYFHESQLIQLSEREDMMEEVIWEIFEREDEEALQNLPLNIEEFETEREEWEDYLEE